MWMIANARLVRPGPNCSPKTRFSPDATGVWSSALALFVIAFQRRTESATFGGVLEVVESSVPVMEVTCAVGLRAIPSNKASTTASTSLVFNSLLIVQLRVVGRKWFRKCFRNHSGSHFPILHPMFESGNHLISGRELPVKEGRGSDRNRNVATTGRTGTTGGTS